MAYDVAKKQEEDRLAALQRQKQRQEYIKQLQVQSREKEIKEAAARREAEEDARKMSQAVAKYNKDMAKKKAAADRVAAQLKQEALEVEVARIKRVKRESQLKCELKESLRKQYEQEEQKLHCAREALIAAKKAEKVKLKQEMDEHLELQRQNKLEEQLYVQRIQAENIRRLDANEKKRRDEIARRDKAMAIKVKRMATIMNMHTQITNEKERKQDLGNQIHNERRDALAREKKMRLKRMQDEIFRSVAEQRRLKAEQQQREKEEEARYAESIIKDSQAYAEECKKRRLSKYTKQAQTRQALERETQVRAAARARSEVPLEHLAINKSLIHEIERSGKVEVDVNHYLSQMEEELPTRRRITHRKR